MNKFQLTEEERKDIRKLYGIDEQSTLRHSGNQQKYFNDPSSVKIYNLFRGEFLLTLIPNYWDLTFSGNIAEMKNLTEEQLSGAMDFFTKKGYKQPNPEIKKYQEEIMKSTDYKSFTSATQKTTAFNDGVFGIATAKASISITIKAFESMNAQNNKSELLKNKTMREMKTITSKATPATTITHIEPKKISTSQDVKLKTGTQPIK